jgi:hypothetical protein
MPTLKVGDKEKDGKGPIHGAQWLLAGHNVFGERFYRGTIDGDFGDGTAQACVDAKRSLGFAGSACTPTFGPNLHSFLTGKKSLPAAFLARRLLRKERASKYVYPAAKRVAIIGRPGQGTHSFTVDPTNWQSDNAWDFAFPHGTPLLAIADGTIGDKLGPISSDPNSRFGGLRLYLETEDNEFYYAHLSKFAPVTKPGARVKQGQVIGLSGEASGVDHLHLGVRDWRPFQKIAEN